jgi:hypothetical protein
MLLHNEDDPNSAVEINPADPTGAGGETGFFHHKKGE